MKRISIQVEDDLYDRFSKAVPHGFRRHVMTGLIEIVVDATEKNAAMIGAVYNGEYKLVRIEQDKPS